MIRPQRRRQPTSRRRPTLAPLRLLLAVLVVASILVVGGPPTEAAQPPWGCNPLDRGGTTCRIGGGGGDPGPGETTQTSTSPPGPTFRRLKVPSPPVCEAAGGGGWIPLTDVDAAIFDLGILPGSPDPVEEGQFWILELVTPDGVPQNTGFIACVGDGAPAPPSPPPLPTAGEIWGAWEDARTFEPAVNLDPFVRGLTGLDTLMWYAGPTSDSLAIAINGYGVDAEIAAVEFVWDMGAPSREGVQVYASPIPDPGEVHVYAQPVEAVVIHRIVWTGEAVITGPGLPAGGIVLDLGEALLSVGRAYDVIEVRTPVISG